MRFLFFIWELPQNLLALILILYYTVFYGKIEFSNYKGVTYGWIPTSKVGISLGAFVLLGNKYKLRKDSINHEYGHTIQSFYLGPLYLIIIGIPSGLGNLYSKTFHTLKHGWTTRNSLNWYYNQPWEKWADMLGGVSR